ncbi:MAG: type VI secretion system tube protein Hcp [Deltaproteobacteria bacterium]|nr:type VI secretion system tube protein Hcp [Chloroflexota bacterium]MBM4330036.1 type VI secretion system tube protein Hcp [Deltaproteobacteria bacterium]
MALFIKFDGVDGESNDKAHKGWSDLLSFSWGLHKAGAGTTGATRRRGVVTVEDVVVTKQYDKSGPKLAESVCIGKIFPKVEIHDTTTYGEGNRAVFLKYELRNVMVSSHNVSAAGAGDAVPTESLSLNFGEVKQTYVEYDAKGNKKGNVEMSWKVEEGEKA